MKIGFIGAGNMAVAMIGGMLKSGLCVPEDIFIHDVSEVTLNAVCDKYAVNSVTGNALVPREAEYIFLTVKPIYYESVIDEIKDSIHDGNVIIAVAPGKTLAWLQKKFGSEVAIVRTMPNTPAMVGQGMTAVCPNEHALDKTPEILAIISSFGKAELIEERLFDAVTAVSGSSPAYVFMFIEAMADAAVAEGMPRDKAYVFAAQAVLGSAKLVLETNMHPGALKDMVCSPGGTTIKAVESLKESGFEGNVIKAMKACADKSREMSQQ